MVAEVHQIDTQFYAFLYHLSDTQVFLFLSILIISTSIIAVFIVHKFIPLNLRYKDNGVIGYMSAFVSIIYGVLAGLMALYLINNINYAADAVEHESDAVANIYRDSLWLNPNFRESIHASIRQYLNGVINVEWPKMRNGIPLDSTNEVAINDISTKLSTYPVTTRQDVMSVHELMQDVKTLYNSRQQRIHMTYAALNPEIWVVIAIGTILTLAMNFLYGMNFYLHLVVTTAAGLMTASILFLLITLDKPFEGEFIIEPDAFIYILNHMDTGDLKNQARLQTKNPATKNTNMITKDETATQ